MSIRLLPPEVSRWAAARTCAQWEKKVTSGLAEGGVPVFLPLLTRLNIYHGKRRAVEVPLFPGYVFFGEESLQGNRLVSQACRNRIAQILRPPDPTELRSELLKVAEFLSHHELVQERLYGQPGDVVQVVRGPLRGQQGVIVRLRPNRRQIVLRVSFLGAEFTVDEDDLRKS